MKLQLPNKHWEKGTKANEIGFHDDHHRKLEPVAKKIPVVVLVAELRSISVVELVTLDDDGFTSTEEEDDGKLISFCESQAWKVRDSWLQA